MIKNIALITDFGLNDSYAGVLKGVILNINPDINIIDITHNIKPQNILQAGWILETSFRYFPKNTVFLSIVDPEVGTKSKKLLVKTSEYYFISPDNGLLTFILKNEKIEKIINIENQRFQLNQISSTFHGRDIFAPIASHLSLNPNNLAGFGKQISLNEIKKLNIIHPEKINNYIIGQIVNIDHFGNIITNIPDIFMTNSQKIRLNAMEQRPEIQICNNYSETQEGELLAIIGSSNTLEISQNCGNAQNILNFTIGDQVKIELI